MHSNKYIAQVLRLGLKPIEALAALRSYNPETARDAELVADAIHYFTNQFQLDFGRQLTPLARAA